MATTETLRVAMAGCHRSVTPRPGSHNWGAALARVAEVRVVAAYDRGAETRAEFQATWRDTWGEVAPYHDYQRMLDEVRPDVVCIATRQTHHSDQIVRAVAAGARGILCDKPFVTSLAESDAALDACRAAGVAIAYGTEWRWSEEYRWLARQVRDGAVGTVQAILAHGLPNLIFHGCHWYDIALMLVGDPEPVWVSGRVDEVSAREPDEGRRLDPPGHAWVGLANGATLALLPEGRRARVHHSRQWRAAGDRQRRPAGVPLGGALGYSRREPGRGAGQPGGAAAHRAVAARAGARARPGAGGARFRHHPVRRAAGPAGNGDRLRSP